MTDPASPAPPDAAARDDAAFGRAIATLLLGLGGFLSVGLVAQVLHPGWGLWVTEVVLFLGIPYVLLRTAGLSPFSAAGLGRPWAAGLGFGFGLGAVNFFALAVPLMWVSRTLLPQEVLDAFDSSKLFENQRPVDLWLLISGVVLAAPVCEELFFRGVVQRGLGSRFAPARSVVLCSLLFSLFHLDPVGFLARFELGVLFGLLAWRSGSLWPAIGAHLANNLVSSASYFATKGQDEVPLAWWVPASMFMAGSLGLLALARLARIRPAVLTPPKAPAAGEDLPARGFFSAAWPWALGALVSFGLVFAVDHRAVRTNAADLGAPVTRPGDPPLTKEEEDELAAWRRQARDGALPIEEYKQRRRALADAVKARARAGDQTKR